MEPTNTFELDGRTYAIGKDYKLYEKRQLGAEQFGATCWIPVKNTACPLRNEDLTGKRIDFGNLPKLPFDKVLMVWKFFREVYLKHKSEAFVYWHYDEENGYVPFVPHTQMASSGDVSFDAHVSKFCLDCGVGTPTADTEECPQCGSKNLIKPVRYGTSHSHGSMGAFHSGTDDANELPITGFHITFGKLDKPFAFELCPSMVISGGGVMGSDGRGYRFEKHEVSLSDFIEDPFVQVRHQIDRWVSLVISLPAITRLKEDQSILAYGGKVIACHGDQRVYAQVKKLLDKATPNAPSEILTKSELEKRNKEAKEKKKNSSNSGSTQSKAGGTTSGTPATQGTQGGTGTTTNSKTTAGTTSVGSSEKPAEKESVTTVTQPKSYSNQTAGNFGTVSTSQSIRNEWTKRLTLKPSAVKIPRNDVTVSIDEDGKLKVTEGRSNTVTPRNTPFLEYIRTLPPFDKQICLDYFIKAIAESVGELLNAYKGSSDAHFNQSAEIWDDLKTQLGEIVHEPNEYDWKKITEELQYREHTIGEAFNQFLGYYELESENLPTQHTPVYATTLMGLWMIQQACKAAHSSTISLSRFGEVFDLTLEPAKALLEQFLIAETANCEGEFEFTEVTSK